ncbi:MAG: hypothetical protein V3U08_00015 [Nitrospirales bacterium]
MQTLGACRYPSPLQESRVSFINEAAQVLVCSTTDELKAFWQFGSAHRAFETAGDRANCGDLDRACALSKLG